MPVGKIGSPVVFDGRTGALNPGPAPGSASAPMKVKIPNPSRKQGRFDVVPPVAFCREITITNLDATSLLFFYPGNMQSPDYIQLAVGAPPLTLDANMTEFSVWSSTAAACQWQAVAIVAS